MVYGHTQWNEWNEHLTYRKGRSSFAIAVLIRQERVDGDPGTGINPYFDVEDQRLFELEGQRVHHVDIGRIYRLRQGQRAGDVRYPRR